MVVVRFYRMSIQVQRHGQQKRVTTREEGVRMDLGGINERERGDEEGKNKGRCAISSHFVVESSTRSPAEVLQHRENRIKKSLTNLAHAKSRLGNSFLFFS